MYYFYCILHNHLLFQSAFQQLLFCADSLSLKETHSGTKFAAPAK